MAEKFGKKYTAVAGAINDEVRAMEALKNGDKKMESVPIVRTKTSKRVSLYTRKQN